MNKHLIELFQNQSIVETIKKKLPLLFQMAEAETSRAGKVGMEVGSLREKILISLLIYKFGEENVDTDISITKHEIDVALFGEGISIKSITNTALRDSIPRGVKISWTVDKDSARVFMENYEPVCDLLLAHIHWVGNQLGGLFHISVEVQKDAIRAIGKEKYIKLPKLSTNPRGVEISLEGMTELVKDNRTNVIDIFWEKINIEFDQYKRWVDYWKEENQ